MLDNGYEYLAATRLALFWSDLHWAMTIEVFGFSPRRGIPDLMVHTFGDEIVGRSFAGLDRQPQRERYVATHPNNETTFYEPIAAGPWQDSDCEELVSDATRVVRLRGRDIAIPKREDYAKRGIELRGDHLAVFELCRYLADIARHDVLATDTEQRANAPRDLERILVLDEWHHPDLAAQEKPSDSRTFRELADVLTTGDIRRYSAKQSPNTHWRNWPEGGLL